MKRRVVVAGAILWAAANLGVLADGATKAGSADLLIREVTDTLLPSGVYNVVTYAAPRAVKVAELGLREAGVAAGPLFLRADELRIFSSRAAMDARPQARLWFNAREGGQLWYHTGGAGSAAGHVLQPGEVLVIYTRVSAQPIAWANVLR